MKYIANGLLLTLSSGLTFLPEYYDYETINKINSGLSKGSIRVVLGRLKRRGLVGRIERNQKVYFRLTAAGTAYLKKRFFRKEVGQKWDKKWRLFIIRNKQSVLNEFGFAKIRNGIYISPFFYRNTRLLERAICFEAVSLFSMEDRKLAMTFWQFEKFAALYQDFLRRASKPSLSKDKILKLIDDYGDLLQTTPVLPKELLPADWPGEMVAKVFMRLVKEHFSTQARSVL